MKNTKFSLIAILLPALVFIGASLKVHAWPSGPPQVDICVKNNLPAGYTGGTGYERTYIKYYMDGGVRMSARFGRGGEKCEKFNEGQRVHVKIQISESGGSFSSACGQNWMDAPATVRVEYGPWTCWK